MATGNVLKIGTDEPKPKCDSKGPFFLFMHHLPYSELWGTTPSLRRRRQVELWNGAFRYETVWMRTGQIFINSNQTDASQVQKGMNFLEHDSIQWWILIKVWLRLKILWLIMTDDKPTNEPFCILIKSEGLLKKEKAHKHIHYSISWKFFCVLPSTTMSPRPIVLSTWPYLFL